LRKKESQIDLTIPLSEVPIKEENLDLHHNTQNYIERENQEEYSQFLKTGVSFRHISDKVSMDIWNIIVKKL